MTATSRGQSTITSFLILGPVVATLVAAIANAELRNALIAAMPLLARYVGVLIAPALLVWAVCRWRGSRIPAASFLVAGLCLAFALYAGLAQTTAFALLFAGAAVIGRALIGGTAEPTSGMLVTSMLAGLGTVIGIVGWLLPVPIHSAAFYLFLFGAIVFLGRRLLVESSQVIATEWVRVVSAHQTIAFFCVAMVGFAGIFLWLPSLNPDDNSAHLLLGNQLLADGYSHLDVSTQIFAVAPWANNVIQAMLALLSGADARSATGLVWLLFGCAGAYRLARALDADEPVSLLAAALYASHPLTAYYGSTLQVDGASAACLLHLAAVCIHVDRNRAEAASPILIGALCGILAGLKVTNLVFLAIFGSWLLWRLLSRGKLSRAIIIIAVAAAIAGSSYFYAYFITGNPLFPLYNGVFKSAYAPAVNFADARWHTGVQPSVLWDLTFSTGKFMEAYPGAAGLSLLALLGGALVALRSGGWRAALTLIGVLAAAVVFFQVQYLRYVFPAVALVATVAVVSFFSAGHRRAAIVAMTLLILAQAGLVRTSSWIFNSGVAEEMLAKGPEALPAIEGRFVPEKVLIRKLAAGNDRFCLLMADPTTAYVAIAPGRTLTTAFYDSRLNALGQWANADATGSRWQQSLASIGATHVEIRPAQANPALMTALSGEGFSVSSQLGDAQIWSRDGQSPEKCLTGMIGARNEAKRLFQ